MPAFVLLSNTKLTAYWKNIYITSSLFKVGTEYNLGLLFETLYDCGGQQGDHDLVVAGQGKPLSPLGRGH